MKMLSLSKELSENAYPGRGIVIGRTEDGTKAVIAYFIMGRSTNSRNRVFVTEGDGIRTQCHDPAKMEDPSLVIYAPVRAETSGTGEKACGAAKAAGRRPLSDRRAKDAGFWPGGSLYDHRGADQSHRQEKAAGTVEKRQYGPGAAICPGTGRLRGVRAGRK